MAMLRLARISIHAPVKGATFLSNTYGLIHGYFNPRTREGCDIFCRLFGWLIVDISIHAPVKGAT